MDRLPEGGSRKVPFSKPQVNISPVVSAGDYCMSGSINGVDVSLLLDTGAVVTLLRDDTWLRVTTNTPKHLRPWSSIIPAGTALTVCRCATVELELKIFNRDCCGEL